MNRRTFARTAGSLLAGSMLSAAPVMAGEPADPAADNGSEAPFGLSVMLWTVFRELPFEQRLEKLAEAGYKNVELVGEYEKWSEQDFDRANAKRKELGITFDCTAGLKHSLCDPSERAALLGDFRKTLPVMRKLDIPAMIFLSGNTVPGMSIREQQQSCVDGLKAAAKLVEGEKINGEPVRVLLENIDPEENPRYFLTSVNTGFEIIKAVNHPQVQFLYDFFHEQISEGNLIEKLEKNVQHVGLVHIADVPGRHHPGTGEINYKNIFRKLAELKYSRIAAMEFMPIGDPVAELRAAREFAIESARL
jgi:hydroxypyruvate isomerase